MTQFLPTLSPPVEISNAKLTKFDDITLTVSPILNFMKAPISLLPNFLLKQLGEAKLKLRSGSSRQNANFKFYVILRNSERSQFQIQRAQLENYRSLQDRIQDAETWRDVLQKKLRESEIQSKQLRDQQRSIREQKVKKSKI